MFEVINHSFIGGTYAKKMLIHDGCEVMSHQHHFDHLSILAQGCVIIEVEGEQSVHYAPAEITIKAGQHHKITAINGAAVWYCIHAIADEDTDHDNIDDVLIQKVA